MNDRYHALLNAMSDAFFVGEVLFDEAGHPEDLLFLEVNRAFLALGGPDPVGRRLRELTPTIEQHWLDAYGAVALTAQPVRFENTSGDRWFDVSAFRVGAPEQRRVGVLFNDITDRKDAEAAGVERARFEAERAAYLRLQESHQEIQATLDNAGDAIITNDEFGVIISFSRSAERLFGWAASEVIGRDHEILLSEDERPASRKRMAALRWPDAAFGGVNVRDALRKDGSRFRLEVSLSALVRDGRPVYIALARDISERDRLERMQREFVSTVSHELRTPLTSVTGALSLLATGALGAVPPRAAGMLDIAVRNCTRLADLISDLMDVERLTQGKMRYDIGTHALTELAERAIADIAVYADNFGVRITLQRGDARPRVNADPARLEQVIGNLLTNAVKFSPKDGRVTVVVSERDGCARLEIADEGPGVPESFESRIFERFAQADTSDTRAKGGTGLGLAISKQLIEAMGGEIGYQSRVSVGTTFFIALPLAST